MVWMDVTILVSSLISAFLTRTKPRRSEPTLCEGFTRTVPPVGTHQHAAQNQNGGPGQVQCLVSLHVARCRDDFEQSLFFEAQADFFQRFLELRDRARPYSVKLQNLAFTELGQLAQTGDAFSFQSAPSGRSNSGKKSTFRSALRLAKRAGWAV